jgi:anti-sigma factor RsiW
MTCDFTERVSLLIDGELSAAEARETERHILNCSECQQVRSEFLNLRSQINEIAISAQTVPLRGELKQILAPKSAPAAPRFGWAFGPAAAAFATLAIVGVIAALLFFHQSNNSSRNSQVAQASPSPVNTASGSVVPTPADDSENNGTKGQPVKNKQVDKPKPTTPEQQKPAPRPAPVRSPRPGEQFAAVPEPVRPGDTQTMTAMHFEKSELLLRAFRNVRLSERGVSAEVGYEKKRAQQLVYQNMMLRREADAAGDVQTSALLESLEPILLDIANLPAKPEDSDVQVIKDRVERKNIVALLQVNSMALARALD